MQTVGASKLSLSLYLFLMMRAVSKNCRWRFDGRSSSVPGFVGDVYLSQFVASSGSMLG